MNITAMKLETIYGEPLVLEGAEINGVIHDLLSEVTVRQTYSNHEDKPIEAVYTFPMPIDAVLLNMTVQIGERTLSGRILPKKEAEERYEEAITDGNSAMMLQKVESGMYTANVGNIAPGERVSLVMTYTTRHELRDGSVRFRLPTVIAPRYGNALQAGFEEHQVPETRLAAENRFSFILTAQGKLAGGDITSPSHKLVMNKTAHGIDISLADGRATMDRDIIVVFKPELPPLSCAWQGHDLNEQTAVMAWFTPLFNPKQATARHIKLVLDCSGSMGGEKMTRARAAAMAVLDDLREGDYFNITRFGSNHVTTFPAMVQANEINLQKARHVIRKMSADLGGTEMEEALDQVYAIPHPQGIKADILLVTDGEVYQHESIIESWSTRETRVFTVGIGDQVSEVLLQDLARTTNAVCELAVLNEKIEPAIMAQFKRIGQPRINKLEIKWPDGMIPETLSLPKAVFANDAFWINAQFKQAPNGPVAIELALDSGETLQQGAIISTFPENTAVPISTVARLAAGDRMARTDDEEVVQSIAVSYQLMSTKTNYIFVDVRENKLDDLPEMRKVGQMMPSGWAAAGAPIAASMDSMSDMVDFGFKECLAPMEETRAAPPTRSRFPDLQRKSMAPPDKFPTPDTEMFGFDDEIIVIGIPDFLTRLAQEFGNPKDLIAAGSYPEHMLPDELQNYILAQVQAQASGMEALLQAVIYLANKYSDRLDKQTNRFYSKLAKTFQPAMDLSQSLQVYFP